jgi:hypothetical protein
VNPIANVSAFAGSARARVSFEDVTWAAGTNALATPLP